MSSLAFRDCRHTKKTVDYCKSKDLVVIGDIKRGDIGSTSAAYAVGHLGHVQVGSKKYAGFDEDFATVNPYLGSDGVKPFIEVCKEENKGLEIKVTDPELLEITGGIIQGMSGAPILQNGKIAGAVTHVFVNDPARGYGIFIENMLKHVE